jgi:zinc/manganese transport system permease protein
MVVVLPQSRDRRGRAAAVQAIGALSTFALLTLPAAAALLATRSVRGTFATAAALSVVLPSLALAASFYLDLPAGPAAVALLALGLPLAALTNGFGDGESGPRRPVRRHASAVSKRQAPALPGSEGVL